MMFNMKYNMINIIVFVATCKECWAKFQHSSSSQNLLSNSIDPVYKEPQKGSDPTSFEQCSTELLTMFLSVEGVNFLITEIANQEREPVKDVLERLATLHGLHVHKSAYPRDLRRISQSAPEPDEDAVLLIRKDQEIDEVKKEITDRAENLLNIFTNPYVKEQKEDDFTSPNSLPRALLLLQSESGIVLQKNWVDLAPRTSLLDVLKAAEVEYPSLNFRLKRLKSKGCVGLGTIGSLRGTPQNPLKFTVFTSALEIEWESSCLPKASDLMIYPGYVISISTSLA